MKQRIFLSFLLCLTAVCLLSFTADVEYQRGDVNHDGNVSVADVSSLIDYLVSGTWDDEPVNPSEPQKEIFTVNGISFTMVTVEGGTFTMGATAEQGDDADVLEYPAHEVTVSSFSIGQTEVTQALWQAVMGNNPSDFADNPQRPVECVSWYDCQTFISNLNQLTGKSFRLPTEAEWEFAARGGNLSRGYKYAGSNNIDDVAWYWDNIPSYQSGTAGYGTQSVATKLPNELGLYDMSGNVFEWCQDRYGNYGGEEPTDTIVEPLPNGYLQVERGGSWRALERGCRVFYRSYDFQNETVNVVGLRLAL
jgi:formylglycine-generating enzyme required for sulfatase activity